MKAAESFFYSMLVLVAGVVILGFFFNIRGCMQEQRVELNKCIEATKEPLECQKAIQQ